MARFSLLLSFLSAGASLLGADAFVHPLSPSVGQAPAFNLNMSKKDSDDEVVVHSLPVGSFVEFQEKKRVHIGKIDTINHNLSKVRYHIVDNEGHKFSISEKEVLYSMPCPNSPGQATKLYEEFSRAQSAPLDTLQNELDVSSELVEMAWEEALEDELSDHTITPNDFVELVHSHSADVMEKYLAWKLLKSEMAHVFFKEIKDHGKVVAFKAKPRKSVTATKEVYCKTHQDDNGICFV